MSCSGSGREKAESESTRQALVEQLWERNEEGRKETNRKPSKRIREGSLSNQAERTEENREARAESEHRRSHCEAETGRKRKGRSRGQVAGGGTEGDERNRQAPKEPLPGENGKKGKERAEGGVVRSEQKRTKESRKQAESPEEKRTRGSGKEGKHRWNSCGSETGKDERKRTESRVRRTGKESMGNQAGKNGENRGSESGKVALRKPL